LCKGLTHPNIDVTIDQSEITLADCRPASVQPAN
jgi:hypothetical protein